MIEIVYSDEGGGGAGLTITALEESQSADICHVRQSLVSSGYCVTLALTRNNMEYHNMAQHLQQHIINEVNNVNKEKGFRI